MPPDIQNTLAVLRKRSTLLIGIGTLIAWVTVFHLVLAIILSWQESTLIRWTTVSITGVIFLLGVCHSTYHHRSELLFDQITKQLRWDVRGVSASDAETAPSLDNRIILRVYAQSSALPFVTSKHAVGIYFGINLAITVASLLYLNCSS